MNKTLTINLGGRIFHVDESAYQLLYDYLYNLRHAFERQEDGEEIVNDLENRLAELLQESLNDRQEVVSTTIVEDNIKKLGRPEEISGEQPEPDESGKKEEKEGTEDTTSDSGNQPQKTEETDKQQSETKDSDRKVSKRLFRDPDNRILGGVAGGLALYLNWDPTLIRLALLVLLFAGYGTLIPIYLVCWLVIPKANTAADKLSMHGRPVTMENIGKVVTDSFDHANEYLRSDKPRTTLQRFADGLVTFCGILIKIALVIMAIICAPVLLALLLVLFALVLAGIAYICGGWTMGVAPEWFNSGFAHASTIAIWCYVCGIIGGILLITCFVSSIFRMAFKWKGLSQQTMKVLLITAIITIAASVVLGFIGGWHFPPFEYQPIIQYDYT